SYFRDIRNFRYDTQLPPPETDDAVWDFLTQKSGYCVQFATGMTVMARTLGILARLAVGFLPVAPSTEVRGEFVVSGRQ
ncbi:transglutaminase-like domain-containing protein, partial [Streptococcus pyogenes]|uniref:transglutaminase-like domain-containing protein n=1 Tax=Streptococcus pyogenes TaxID=1314 RepID=UPI003DA0C005